MINTVLPISQIACPKNTGFLITLPLDVVDVGGASGGTASAAEATGSEFWTAACSIREGGLPADIEWFEDASSK
jgi:hypothetical protein